MPGFDFRSLFTETPELQLVSGPGATSEWRIKRKSLMDEDSDPRFPAFQQAWKQGAGLGDLFGPDPFKLQGTVAPSGGDNTRADVAKVQTLLGKTGHLDLGSGGPSGYANPDTDKARIAAAPKTPFGSAQAADRWSAGNMADALLGKGDYTDAITYFRDEIDRNRAEAMPHLAAVHQIMGDKNPGQAAKFATQMQTAGLTQEIPDGPQPDGSIRITIRPRPPMSKPVPAAAMRRRIRMPHRGRIIRDSNISLMMCSVTKVDIPTTRTTLAEKRSTASPRIR